MASDMQELPSEGWRTYFDRLSRELGAVDATVEVEGSDLGAQVEAERLVLTGISYDDRDDVLAISLAEPGDLRDGIEHMVQQPRRIAVDGTEAALPTTIEAEDADGQITRVELHAVPELPEQ
ncbi:MAG TPA: DUF5335 family protein [Solirubrobacteraceae bacterium]|jgi:hypothetical protein